MIKMLYYHPSIKGIGRIKNNIIMLYTSIYFVEGKAQASQLQNEANKLREMI